MDKEKDNLENKKTQKNEVNEKNKANQKKELNKKEVSKKAVSKKEVNKNKVNEKSEKTQKNKVDEKDKNNELNKKDEQNEVTEKNETKKTKMQITIKISTIILITLLVLIVIAVGLVMTYINGKLGKMQIEEIDENNLAISEKVDQQMSKYRNIAILGVDSRYDTYDSDYRTDCIMVASINTENNDVQLYSIYRDTYLEMELDGEKKLNKLNQAYYGGIENTLKTINTNLDLNIKEFVMADFNAVADLVDAVGGIDINVDSSELQYINNYIKDVSRVTGMNARTISRTGTQRLTGVQAVAYCRIRYTAGRDYKRTERMREVLQKIIDKIKGLSIIEINNLLDTMLPKIRTNVTADEIKELIPVALSFNIKKSFGWPYRTKSIEINGDYYGATATLETNVEQLHREVYGQENYEASERVKEISEKIKEKTGVNENTVSDT